MGYGLATRQLLGLAAVATWIAAVPAPADDWNTGVGGRPARYSRSTEIGPPAPTILWQGSVSAQVAQQAAIEGNIVVMARITDLQNTLLGTTIVAHNLTTGAILWQMQLPIDNPVSDWRSRVSAIRDGQVYATRAGNTNASPLYALNASTGAVIWRSQDPIDETSTESLSFAPNGDPIVGNFRSLMRIRKTDGTTAWSAPRTSPTSDGSSAAVFGDHAYIWEASGNGPRVAVHDINTGTRLYMSDAIGGGFVQQLGLLAGPDGTVYAPRTQNNPATDFFVAYQDTGTALMERWRAPLGYVPFASFAVGPDGSVYMYTTTRVGNDTEISILRRNPGTGAVVSISPTILTNFPAQPRIAIDSEGKVFFTNGGFSRGALYSFDADLTERWSQSVQNVNVGGPALGQDGILVVCGVGTDVRAYREALLEVAPDSFTLFRGVQVSGNLQSLRYSDDDRFVARPGVVLNQAERPIQLILDGTAPASEVSAVRFRLEAHVNISNIRQHIELFDYIANQWVEFDARIGATADSVVSVSVSEDPNRFIDAGTRQMRARLSWKEAGPVFSYPWQARVDQAIWRIRP